VTERKPPGVSFETWIDRQIRDAAERGEFDNLPGAGKPLPGAGQPDDENWWLREYLRREGVTGEVMLPVPLVLRREIENLPATVRTLPTERSVRDAVAELNTRVLACLREPSELRVPLRPVNADAVVERWRAERASRAEERPEPAQPEPEPSPADTGARPWRRWWHRLSRR